MAIGGPAPAPSLPEPAAPVAAAAQNAAPAVDPTSVARPLPLPAETAPIADRMTQKVRDSGVKSQKILKLLKQFLKGLDAQAAGDAEKVKRGESILEKFFDQVGKLPAQSEIRVNQVSFEQASVKSFFEYKAEKTVQPAVEETV
jgi:hypothetical protein